MTSGIAILLIFAFGLMSFLFALAESSLFSLGQQAVQRLRQRKASDAEWIVNKLSKPNGIVATLVFGNTLFNSAIWATGLMMVIKGAWPPVATLVALVLMILLGCEVIPKALAVRLPEKWSLAVVRPLRFMEWTARPLEKLADWMGDAINQWAPKRLRGEITRGGGDSDYQELLELGHQQGVLGQGEKEIIQEIIELDRKCATDVMTPRSQVKAIAFDMPIQDMRSEARQASFRRMPLYSESLDQIVGILDTRLLFLNPSGDLFECTELPSFVPESMNLLALFKSLQRQRRGLAVVVDEFGGLAGVVTMEDILEAILGPIRNENESEDFEFEVLASGLWRVSGLLEIEVFREHCPELGEVHEVDTMGGLFTMKLGYVPDGEETVQYGGLKLTSKVVGERRVKELLVERLSDHEDKKANSIFNDLMNLLLLFIFVMGLALSFLFSGMESGMLSTNRLALRRRARAGDHSASALMSYLDETESFLWTVLVGNTLANLMIVAPLLLGLRALLPTQPWLSGLSLVLLLLLLYTFCDLFPKLLYRRFPDSLTIGSIGPYRFFHGLLAPVVFLVSGFADLMLKVSGGKALNARLFTNREEMRQVMAHSSQNLTMEEKSMIDRVMDLQSRSLASVMTPMNQTTCLNRDQTILEVVKIAQERALTRFPVLGIQEGKTVVVGAFHLKAMLHDWEKHCDELVGDHLTGVMRLPSELSADEALRKMQASGQRVALVVKADQKELGWVNLRDILKTVFGEVNL